MSKVTIQKHLEAYEATPEEWKKGHDDAITCFDVQDSIAFGLLILELIYFTRSILAHFRTSGISE